MKNTKSIKNGILVSIYLIFIFVIGFTFGGCNNTKLEKYYGIDNDFQISLTSDYKQINSQDRGTCFTAEIFWSESNSYDLFVTKWNKNDMPSEIDNLSKFAYSDYRNGINKTIEYDEQNKLCFSRNTNSDNSRIYYYATTNYYYRVELQGITKTTLEFVKTMKFLQEDQVFNIDKTINENSNIHKYKYNSGLSSPTIFGSRVISMYLYNKTPELVI